MQPSLLAQRRSGEKEHPRGQTPQHFLNFLWLQGVRSLPPQLSSAQLLPDQPKHGPLGQGSCQRGPGRNKTDLLVTTQLASYPQPLSVSTGDCRRGATLPRRRGSPVHAVRAWAAGLPPELDRAGLCTLRQDCPCFRFACKRQTCTSAAMALSSALPLDQHVVRHKPNLCSRMREGKSGSSCWLWVISLLVEALTRFLEH